MKTTPKNLHAFQQAFDFTNFDAVSYQQQIAVAYKVLLREKVGELQEKLLAANPDQYEQFVFKSKALPTDDFLDFCAIPEISHLLLHLDQANPSQVAAVLTRALDAEISKRMHVYDPQKHSQLWTADGSFYIKYSFQTQTYAEYEAYCLLDKVPIDFFSPYALKISNADVNEPAESVIAAYDFNEIEVLCNWIDESVAPLAGYLPITHQVSTFLRAIVLNQIKNPGQGVNYVSGSDARYIGRTVLSNALGISQELLVESFVHESIHATLYMGDACTPWLPTRQQTHLAGYRAVSPWTNHHISISSIQEAIFVWYGVYKLWSVALEKGLYNEQRVLDRLAFVGQGFAGLNISRIAAACDFEISAELRETVEMMKNDVVRGVKVH